MTSSPETGKQALGARMEGEEEKPLQIDESQEAVVKPGEGERGVGNDDEGALTSPKPPAGTSAPEGNEGLKDREEDAREDLDGERGGRHEGEGSEQETEGKGGGEHEEASGEHETERTLLDPLKPPAATGEEETRFGVQLQEDLKQRIGEAEGTAAGSGEGGAGVDEEHTPSQANVRSGESENSSKKQPLIAQQPRRHEEEPAVHAISPQETKMNAGAVGPAFESAARPVSASGPTKLGKVVERQGTSNPRLHIDTFDPYDDVEPENMEAKKPNVRVRRQKQTEDPSIPDKPKSPDSPGVTVDMIDDALGLLEDD
eukprot:CAMPEP_0184485068 /NCGR_PEP_ID=MMETSP0113_2-20130426/6713_1 /TAXON_ID=91329 /ORGANISM="Norrisiella sphaerica, Strain BC52" /LENGTH=314 /DNA_ID=CAMNT_0026866345 /DNA_START=91 /DNA_END=1035 /DNA_ORIENTATION=-